MTPIKQLLHYFGSHATIWLFIEKEKLRGSDVGCSIVVVPNDFALQYCVRLVLVQHSAVKFPEILHDTDQQPQLISFELIWEQFIRI